MASETWEKLSLAEKEANALVDEAKAKSATLLAKVRQALQEERTKTLEEARRLGEEAVAQRKAEAEEKAMVIRQETDERIAELHWVSGEKLLTAAQFIVERVLE
ncbi:MAG TPA: hypothetical protein GX391_02975 [Firmicutes bacterium]|jgi:vacuolar-type H+-ATPase subunit H|nr:hypothetical protein [Bacillota bacterium]HOQ23900.1 hypothetical protein [Bacillota bacterium]HPT67152.1 hypothetical protein [Bacillota bacterium]